MARSFIARSTRLRRRDEEGSVLVLVLVVSLLLVAALTVALASSTSNLNGASNYRNSSQASLAAQSGLAAAYAAANAAGSSTNSYTSFPCSLNASLSAPGATSSYAVTIQYRAGTTPLDCTGTTLGGTVAPTAATLLSVGTTPHGSSTEMEEVVNISAAPTVPPQALGYAIFTSSNLDLNNAATIDQVGSNPPPNVYVGQTLTCTNGTISEGNLITYAPVSLSNACHFSGSLTAAGAVSLANSAIVGGSVTSYGTSTSSGITMSGTSVIGANATATDSTPATGTIGLSNSAAINGNADASGSITVSGGATIKGTSTQDDASLASQIMPSTISFPVTNPQVADWQGKGYTVIPVGDTTAIPPQQSCSSYFTGRSGVSDPFTQAIETATTPTVIYAPTCPVTYHGTNSFAVNADVVLEVQSLTLNNSNTFASTNPSTSHYFSIYADICGVPTGQSACSQPVSCSTSTVDVTFSNSTDFASSLDVFIYTPGEVDYANAPSMQGQILACGGFIGTNAFTLDFVPGPAGALPWTSATPTPPTLTVAQKFLLKG